MKMTYQIRELLPSERYLMKEFLYEAIFRRPEEAPFPREVLNEPKLKVYYEDFGQPEDCCLVAVIEDRPVGAVWTRRIKGEIKGYGYVDEDTPEFTMSLFPEFRNRGIGTALLNAMLSFMKEKGYKRLSLSVQKENYAVRMYQRAGFQVVEDIDDEYIMVYELHK